MKKIVITGPESTGKTTLATKVADYFNVEPVPEYARDFLAKLGRPYVEKDLMKLVQSQIFFEDVASLSVNCSRVNIVPFTELF